MLKKAKPIPQDLDPTSVAYEWYRDTLLTGYERGLHSQVVHFLEEFPVNDATMGRLLVDLMGRITTLPERLQLLQDTGFSFIKRMEVTQPKTLGEANKDPRKRKVSRRWEDHRGDLLEKVLVAVLDVFLDNVGSHHEQIQWLHRLKSLNVAGTVWGEAAMGVWFRTANHYHSYSKDLHPGLRLILGELRVPAFTWKQLRPYLIMGDVLEAQGYYHKLAKKYPEYFQPVAT